jgi:uncharacterized protein (TIGR02145 family)
MASHSFTSKDNLMRILTFFLLSVLVVTSCKTEEPQNPPTVITQSASDITIKGVVLNGNVTDEGFTATTERGFVYSDKNTNPSVGDLKIQSGYGKGVYSVTLKNLVPNTLYYYNTYATNTKGTSYGAAQSFTTKDIVVPTLKTNIPIYITYNEAIVDGEVLDDGGGKVLENGFVISLTSNPTILNSKTKISTGIGPIAVEYTKASPNTKFYVRTYAINEKGVGYGNEVSFTTRELKTVISKTGRVWMDRNLGASRVATNLNDEQAYGDYYQWGRNANGHQLKTSKTTTSLSSTDKTEHDLFILAPENPNNWRNPKKDNLWQGVNGINNVCPNGFRVPTIFEWQEEVATWTSKNDDGAISSPLKLSDTGFRNTNGRLTNVGEFGYYWSSTIYSSESVKAENFTFDGGNTYARHGPGEGTVRGEGLPVRCIKD